MSAVGSSGPVPLPFKQSNSYGVYEKNQDATVYVGNLDDRITDTLLWELFTQAGPVVDVHIPRDRINQTHYGYGFVELQAEQDADYAAKVMNGVKLFGRPLKVNRASTDRKNLDVGANLFVGNLDDQVDEAMLLETFRSFGNVLSVKVAREGEGGMGPSRGFGFVSFDAFEASDAAIEAMSGQYLYNRPIAVNYAYKKDGKSERHGSAAERLLAAQAKQSGLLNSVQPLQSLVPPPQMQPQPFPNLGSIGYRPSQPGHPSWPPMPMPPMMMQPGPGFNMPMPPPMQMPMMMMPPPPFYNPNYPQPPYPYPHPHPHPHPNQQHPPQ